MLIFDELISEKTAAQFNKLEEFYNPEEVIMFDIETTGLSASNSFIYLIGINYKSTDGWHITQFFNENGESEAELLTAFMEKLSSYRYLLHFNGDSFDIPFVRKRIQLLNLKEKSPIPDDLDRLVSVDLYKMIKPFKSALGLLNLKQKTIESCLGLQRIDIYNGGELIDIYYRFLTRTALSDQALLLQHNRDDMEGMYYLTSILSLRALSAGEIELNNISCDADLKGLLRLKLSITMKHSLSFRITASYAGIHLNVYESSGCLIIPILTDELKFFFQDYRNYYYYPELDTAYHKDTEKTVPSSFREKAKKDNCYIRRAGYFIPQLHLNITAGFRYTASDKNSYIEIDDSFLGNEELLTRYTQKMAGLILTSK